jgi:hypothetical protein
MEVGPNRTGPHQADISWKIGIYTPRPLYFASPAGRIKMDYQAGGMHPGIGPATGNHTNVLVCDFADRFFNPGLHRWGMGLALPAIVADTAEFNTGRVPVHIILPGA